MKNQAGKSGVEIGFMDVNQMSGLGKVFYMLFILSFVGGLMYYFYDKMVLGPESAEAEKQKRFEQKKAARLAKATKKN